MTDEWRKLYSQSGYQYVEPIEYLPCPWSVPCAKAIRKAGDEDKDEGPTYPRETHYP
jgi:hypothetical protein